MEDVVARHELDSGEVQDAIAGDLDRIVGAVIGTRRIGRDRLCKPHRASPSASSFRSRAVGHDRVVAEVKGRGSFSSRPGRKLRARIERDGIITNTTRVDVELLALRERPGPPREQAPAAYPPMTLSLAVEATSKVEQAMTGRIIEQDDRIVLYRGSQRVGGEVSRQQAGDLRHIRVPPVRHRQVRVVRLPAATSDVAAVVRQGLPTASVRDRTDIRRGCRPGSRSQDRGCIEPSCFPVGSAGVGGVHCGRVDRVE